jgi:hypothetical protein
MEMKEHDHGEILFFHKICKWYECMQGTKYVVDLI